MGTWNGRGWGRRWGKRGATNVEGGGSKMKGRRRAGSLRKEVIRSGWERGRWIEMGSGDSWLHSLEVAQYYNIPSLVLNVLHS